MLLGTTPGTLSVGDGSPKTLASSQIRSGFDAVGLEPSDLGSKNSGGQPNRGKRSQRGFNITEMRESSNIGNKNASNQEYAGAKNSQAGNLTKL